MRNLRMPKHNYFITFLLIAFLGLMIGCSPSETSDQIQEKDSKIENPDSSKQDNGNEVQKEDVKEGSDTIPDDSLDKKLPEKNEYAQMMELAFMGIGTVISEDFEANLVGDAINEISVEKIDKCRIINCGKSIYLINSNPDKGIVAIIRTNWKDEKGKQTVFRKYQIKAGEHIKIGCNKWCASEINIIFKRVIVSADYLDLS